MCICVSGDSFLAIFLQNGNSALALHLLLATLWALSMCRMALFVVASDIIQSLFVDNNSVIGHTLYIFYYHLVIWMVEVLLVALDAHVAGNVVYCSINAMLILTLSEALENLAYILAVVFEANIALRVLQLARSRLQLLAGWAWVWTVYI